MMQKIQKRVISKILATILFVFAVSVTFAASSETVDLGDCIVYVPSQIDYNNKNPLVVALSPGADAQGMINLWRNIAERHKWIILASKEFQNGCDMEAVLHRVAAKVEKVFLNFPVDKNRVIATGFSGGGMGSHAFSFLHPKLIAAVVINTGMIHEYYFNQASEYLYPKSKLVVFLASPTDFRYQEMKRNKDFLEKLGWKTKWIEFQGGHKFAPEVVYEQAVKWLKEQLGN